MDDYPVYPSIPDTRSASSYPHQGALNSYPSYPSVPRTDPATAALQPNPIPLPPPPDLDAALPTEFELVSHSPEDRALLWEVLKERRRVKELELKILEERRKEREAIAAAATPASASEPQAAMEWTSRIGLSALGGNMAAHSPTTEYGQPHQHASYPHADRMPQHQYHPHHPYAPAPSSYTYDHTAATGSTPALRHSHTPPTSSLQNFDRLPGGLGLSSASLAQDPYAPYSHNQKPQQQRLEQQGHVAVTGSPDSLLRSSPGSSGQGSHVSTTLGLWDSPRAMGGPMSASPLGGHHSISINTNMQLHNQGMAPMSNYSSTSASASAPSSLLPTPPQPFSGDLDLGQMYEDPHAHGAQYAVSSGGSNHDAASSPGHFYPTPPPQHPQYQLKQTDTTYQQQHSSMQVKHQRLSDAGSSTGGSSYVPQCPQGQPFNPPQSQHSFPVVPPTASTSQSTFTGAGASASSRKTKKVLVERQVVCQTCQNPLCKLLLRGTADELAVAYDPFYECLKCGPPSPAAAGAGQHQPGSLPVGVPGGYGSGGGGFTGSGLRMTRKRTRQTEDTTMPTVCDVCVRTIGRGGLVPRTRSAPLSFAVEVICTPCSHKYSRCSDCGGGSGRVGVGKWRAKELFENGRKTCKLPHVRVGGGELELSVWEVPWEIRNKKDFGALMASLRMLWSERVLARLAIPEVLEGGEEEWPPGGGPSTVGVEPIQVDRSFADVEDVIVKGWPAREKVLGTSPGLDHDHFRRYLGLSWAKARARRERAAGKLPDPAKYAEGAEDVVMENVRRTTILVPPASTLVGMWIVDWDLRNRTVLLSTSVPFESSDAEDKNIIGVGEVLTRIMMDLEQYNKEHPEAPLRGPQHLWVTTRSISALANARMNDTLTRRRGFVPVDEYIALHPGTDRALFASVPGGHAWIDEPAWIRHPDSGELEVLVRWLGDDIDMERLDEIKDIEYGRKSKEMQIANRSKKVGAAGGAGSAGPTARRA